MAGRSFQYMLTVTIHGALLSELLKLVTALLLLSVARGGVGVSTEASGNSFKSFPNMSKEDLSSEGKGISGRELTTPGPGAVVTFVDMGAEVDLSEVLSLAGVFSSSETENRL